MQIRCTVIDGRVEWGKSSLIRSKFGTVVWKSRAKLEPKYCPFWNSRFGIKNFLSKINAFPLRVSAGQVEKTSSDPLHFPIVNTKGSE